MNDIQSPISSLDQLAEISDLQSLVDLINSSTFNPRNVEQGRQGDLFDLFLEQLGFRLAQYKIIGCEGVDLSVRYVPQLSSRVLPASFSTELAKLAHGFQDVFSSASIESLLLRVSSESRPLIENFINGLISEIMNSREGLVELTRLEAEEIFGEGYVRLLRRRSSGIRQALSSPEPRLFLGRAKSLGELVELINGAAFMPDSLFNPIITNGLATVGFMLAKKRMIKLGDFGDQYELAIDDFPLKSEDVRVVYNSLTQMSPSATLIRGADERVTGQIYDLLFERMAEEEKQKIESTDSMNDDEMANLMERQGEIKEVNRRRAIDQLRSETSSIDDLVALLERAKYEDLYGLGIYLNKLRHILIEIEILIPANLEGMSSDEEEVMRGEYSLAIQSFDFSEDQKNELFDLLENKEKVSREDVMKGLVHFVIDSIQEENESKNNFREAFINLNQEGGALSRGGHDQEKANQLTRLRHAMGFIPRANLGLSGDPGRSQHDLREALLDKLHSDDSTD